MVFCYHKKLSLQLFSFSTPKHAVQFSVKVQFWSELHLYQATRRNKLGHINTELLPPFHPGQAHKKSVNTRRMARPQSREGAHLREDFTEAHWCQGYARGPAEPQDTI